MVMLVVLMLLVTSAMKSSTTNLRIVGNTQIQEEGIAASQQAIEQVLSNNFTQAPAASTVVGMNVDVNNDGTPDYQVSTQSPTCTGSTPIPNAAINWNDPNEMTCKVGDNQAQQQVFYASGVPGQAGTAGASRPSLCIAQQWDIPGQATLLTNTAIRNPQVHQGVAIRVRVGINC
jgi:hypothetical protein